MPPPACREDQTPQEPAYRPTERRERTCPPLPSVALSGFGSDSGRPCSHVVAGCASRGAAPRRSRNHSFLLSHCLDAGSITAQLVYVVGVGELAAAVATAEDMPLGALPRVVTGPSGSIGIDYRAVIPAMVKRVVALDFPRVGHVRDDPSLESECL